MPNQEPQADVEYGGGAHSVKARSVKIGVVYPDSAEGKAIWAIFDAVNKQAPPPLVEFVRYPYAQADKPDAKTIKSGIEGGLIALVSYQEAFGEVYEQIYLEDKKSKGNLPELPVIAMMGGKLPEHFFRYGFSANLFAKVAALYLKRKKEEEKRSEGNRFDESIFDAGIRCIAVFGEKSLEDLADYFRKQLSTFYYGKPGILISGERDGSPKYVVLYGHQKKYKAELQWWLKKTNATIITDASYFSYREEVSAAKINWKDRLIVLNRAGYTAGTGDDYQLFAESAAEFCCGAAAEIAKGEDGPTPKAFSKYLEECHFHRDVDFETISFREDGEIFFPISFFDGNGDKIIRSDFNLRLVTLLSDYGGGMPKEQIAEQIETIDRGIKEFRHELIPRDLDTSKSRDGSFKKLLETVAGVYENHFHSAITSFISRYPRTVKDFFRTAEKPEYEAWLEFYFNLGFELFGMTSKVLFGIMEFSNALDDRYPMQINLEEDDIEDNNALRFYIQKKDSDKVLPLLQFCRELSGAEKFKEIVEKLDGIVEKSKKILESANSDETGKQPKGPNAQPKVQLDCKEQLKKLADECLDGVAAVVVARSQIIAERVVAEQKGKKAGPKEEYLKSTRYPETACYFPCTHKDNLAKLQRLLYFDFYAFKNVLNHGKAPQDHVRFNIFVPAVTRGDLGHSGGIIIEARYKLTLFVLQIIQNSVSRLFGEIFSALQIKTVELANTKSAVGSIMSRNGSHNIGSHVLSALSHQVGTMPDDRILYQYIQQRMDYIATVTTDFPNWTVPTRFVVNLMKTFLSQRHLLEHISESEGLRAWHFHGRHTGVEQTSKIKIHVRKKGNKDDDMVLVDFITYPDDKSKDDKSKPSPTTASLDVDPRLAIPGGTVGQHAFYTILENIIRNAAKHGWSKRSGNAPVTNLEIYIDFLDEQGSDNVVFTIWDNMSDVLLPLARKRGDDSYLLQDSVRNALLAALEEEPLAALPTAAQGLPENTKIGHALNLRPAADFRSKSGTTQETSEKDPHDQTPAQDETSEKGPNDKTSAQDDDHVERAKKQVEGSELKNAVAEQKAEPQNERIKKLRERVVRLRHDNVTLEDLLDELTPAEARKLLEASSPKPSRDSSIRPLVDLGKDLPRHWAQQVRLGQPLITEQGELRRENWGLAEMRISAGYLQRLGIGKIGGIDEDKEQTSIITPVAVKDESGEVYHLGYRFAVPKPKKILIVEPDDGWSIPSDPEKVLKKDGIHIKTIKEINGEDRDSDGYSELDYEYVVMPKSQEALLAKWLPLRAADERQTLSPDDDPFEKWIFPFRLLLAGESPANPDEIDCGQLKSHVTKGEVDEIKKLVFGAWLAKLKTIVEPQKADAAKDVFYLQIQTGSTAAGGGKGLMRDSDLYRIVFRECGHSILLEATREQRNKTARLLTTLLASVPVDRESFPQAAGGKESREYIREQLAGFCDLFKRELRLSSPTGIGVNQDLINCLKALSEGSDAVIPADSRFSGFERAFLRNLQLDLQGDNTLAKNRVKALIRHLVETDRERLNTALDVFCGKLEPPQVQSPSPGLSNIFGNASDPSSVLRKNIELLFGPADSDLSAEFDKLVDKLNSAYQTSDVFLRKYEEDIPTLPPFYRERPQGKASPDGTVTLDNVELAKSDSPADRTIRYVRHDNTAGGLYAEALSGSQSYLNALAKFDLTNLNFTVRLVENALLRVLLVDERVCNFFATRPEELDACKKMRIFVADVSMADAQQPPRPGFVKLNKDDETAFGIPTERSYDILIIHQGIIDKWCSAHDKTVVGTLLKNLRQRVPFVVVTTGRGRPDNIPDDARVLPFTSVESTIFRKYPEKLVLVNTVMNILPTGEGAES